MVLFEKGGWHMTKTASFLVVLLINLVYMQNAALTSDKEMKAQVVASSSDFGPLVDELRCRVRQCKVQRSFQSQVATVDLEVHNVSKSMLRVLVGGEAAERHSSETSSSLTLRLPPLVGILVLLEDKWLQAGSVKLKEPKGPIISLSPNTTNLISFETELQGAIAEHWNSNQLLKVKFSGYRANGFWSGSITSGAVRFR